jgi:hypothetical protein
MQPQDVFNRNFASATAALDQWLSTLPPDARVDREQTADYWRASIKPQQPNACPVEMMLARSQTFDLDIASESVVGRPIADLGLFLPLLEAIAAGRVVHREWRSLATGAGLISEIIVTLADGQNWSMRRFIRAETADTESSAIAHDHTFVPYRRG